MSADLLKDLKAKIWDAVGKGQPLPPMLENDIINTPATASDIYYLLERYAYLVIWDAHNMEEPGRLKPLHLTGASALYNVYDRGSCLVATPVSLLDYHRTLHDALITARALAEEVYKRDWTIEFGGLDRMVRAAWVTLQILGKQHNKFLEILHYEAPASDSVILRLEMGPLAERKLKRSNE